MRCCKIIRNLVTGVIPSTPTPEPPVPMTIWISQSFALSGLTTGYVDSVLTYAWTTAKVLSEQIQATYPYSGSAYFGSNYTFWIALPTGDPAPSGWQINPDPIGDPDLRVNVEWTEGSSFSELYCFEETFEVEDPATWLPYYFTSAFGISEFTAFATYDSQTDDSITSSVQTAFGINAAGTISIAGAFVTIALSGMPLNVADLTSTDDFNNTLLTNLSLIDCP